MRRMLGSLLKVEGLLCKPTSKRLFTDSAANRMTETVMDRMVCKQ